MKVPARLDVVIRPPDKMA